MASPLFQMEDQTDEDFFDKLVDDDEFPVTESGPGLVKVADLDELKAFPNLSISEAGTGLDHSGGESGAVDKEEKQSEDSVAFSADAPGMDNLVLKESAPLVSSDSFAFENEIETNDVAASAGVPEKDKLVSKEGVSHSSSDSFAFDSGLAANVVVDEADVSLNSTNSKSSGSRGASIKQVQWTEFHTDLTQERGNGFGSFSDFFDELGENADPFEKLHNNPTTHSKGTSTAAKNESPDLTYVNPVQYQEGVTYGNAMEQTTSGQDLYDSQYWENLYPGWKYDPSTGEWHQVDGYDANANNQVGFENKARATGGGEVVSDQISEVSFLQQTSQSVAGTMAEGCTTGTVSNWNQLPQGSTEYPPHMVFDPQYPGWYYDTIAQEWRLLDSYTQTVQSTGTDSGSFPPDKDQNLYGDYSQVKDYGSQVMHGDNQVQNWSGTPNFYSHQTLSSWQPDVVAKSEDVANFTENPQSGGFYGSHGLVNNYTEQSMGVKSVGAIPSYDQTGHSNYGSEGMVGFHGFVPSGNSSHQITQKKLEQSQKVHFSNDYHGSQLSNFTEQPFQTTTHQSYILHEGRSSAGRPPHALVTFGFGGKLVVMKGSGNYSTNSAFGSQDSIGGSISVLNLCDVVMEKINAATIGVGACEYFRTLCQQSFPGPLVGGNAGTKELNKWIDERIAYCESPNMDYRKGELLRLLLSLLKIACQHYGKLRSPFGTDQAQKETDCPEAAVAKLFASAKRNGPQSSHYGALTHCLQNMLSEGQIQATAVEVQNLLVSGRTKEALQCAQEGQLWGPALVLAAQLGDQFYVDTVKQMAHRQLIGGSPLRTLCLLIAGQPADVFTTDSGTINGTVQSRSNSMLDDWEENLAIITANPTKGDELVIIHLGDCLLKERGEISAAHTCYLVADANFESYSDSARLCLIGADHWKYPRTYASPDAIQRTELYEYAKVLGNSQSILLPFQPYKLIYAHMLAEVGKVSDSLKYCQAILKSLRTGRAPEVETWKQLVSSLEERIRTHQQGGYSSNLAPGKLVGKLLPLIDSTINRMIGTPPPPAPMGSQNFVQNNEHDHAPVVPRVANSQSTMAMLSLMPSASMEPISEWKGDNRMMMPNRSISEPDFGRTPNQVDPSNEAASSDAQDRASASGAQSRFGRFGSSLLQKTMGWVSKSRSDKQAKLGEQNKFYYDEKLKRWVEEGSEPPAEEVAALQPPPTTATLNGMSDYNIKNALNSESMPLPTNGGPETKSSAQERSPGIPPIPPSSNQFSARGRMGVRSRYVDTFNKGVGTVNSFQSAPVPATKHGAGANAKFFIPTPVAMSEGIENATGESMHQALSTNEVPSTSIATEQVIPSTASSPALSMQRFPSMGNIIPSNMKMGATENGDGSLPYRSRRTASWSGSISDTFNAPKTTEIKPLGEALGMRPSMFMPTDPSQMRMSMSGASLSEDLHEVEL